MRLGSLAVALLVASSAGCGTMHNLFAPPDPVPGPPYIGSGPGICVPFGGVARSALLGTAGPLIGPGQVIWGGIKVFGGDPLEEGVKQIGGGLWFTACGLAAIVDTPVSLVGDIATFPIAYARHKHHPWATWWGTESNGHCLLGRLWPGTSYDEKKTEEQLENSR